MKTKKIRTSATKAATKANSNRNKKNTAKKPTTEFQKVLNSITEFENRSVGLK